MKELFINRKAELQNLVTGLKNGDDFILVAPRRFGKTALAVKALELIEIDKNYTIIDIDLMKYSGGTVKNLAEAIIEKSLNALGLKGKLRKLWNEVDFSLNLKIKYQDIEIEPLIKLFKDNSDEWVLLEDSLQLLETIAIQTKRHLIVFFDEFGELYGLGERVIEMFRSVIQRHKHVSYLFAGSQETVMNKIFLDKSGAFYRFGELIYLKELDKVDEYEYLQENYPITNNIMPNNDLTLLDTIIQELQGHPYYTARVISAFERKPNATIQDYANIINELYEREEAYLALQASKIKSRANALEVLRLISLNLSPYKELAIKSQNIYALCKYLTESGYLYKKSRANYRMTDPLLARYLADRE